MKKLKAKDIVGPIPKITSLKEYFQRYSIMINETGEFPCHHCYGRGKIVAPWEQRDPVEGYKMAERIICTTCNGLPFQLKFKKYYIDAYKKLVAKEKQARIFWYYRKDIIENLLSSAISEDVKKDFINHYRT